MVWADPCLPYFFPNVFLCSSFCIYDFVFELSIDIFFSGSFSITMNDSATGLSSAFSKGLVIGL